VFVQRQVLSFEGSLGFNDGLAEGEIFQDTHVALERGSIYGLVAPSGKTSFVRALPSLPNFLNPSSFRFAYLAADFDFFESNDDDDNSLPVVKTSQDDDDDDDALLLSGAREYYYQNRVHRLVQDLQREIEGLETRAFLINGKTVRFFCSSS
jgi:hypothetical protein